MLPPSPSFLVEAPAALPRASAFVFMAEVEATVMVEAPLKLRAMLATVSSVTMFSEIDTPTAVPSPAASPLVLVSTVSACLASALSSPPRVMLTPRPLLSLPICARVVFCTTAIATPAPTCVPPPLAPFSALVLAVLLLSALAMKWPVEPVTCSPFSTSAMVSLSAMLSAKDAPTPTLLPPVLEPGDGEASTRFSERFSACRSTLPPVRVNAVAVRFGEPLTGSAS